MGETIKSGRTLAGSVTGKACEGRRERRARETRRKILQAALELFAERDIDSVTMEEIAGRADVARATVFNYFSSKENLCACCGELQAEVLQEAVREGHIQGATVSEKLAQAVRVMAGDDSGQPEQCRPLLIRALAALKPGELPEHRLQVLNVLREWVVEGQATGELRSDIPAEELAGFLMGLQFQAMLIWAFGYVDTSLADHQVRVLTLALEGLRAERPVADDRRTAQDGNDPTAGTRSSAVGA